MLLIGLTGSIATGKSTVCSLLRQPPYSLPIIDADVLARKVVEPGTRGYRKIVDYFGPTTPDLLQDDPDGKYHEHGAPLNRPALGRRVFGDSEQRRRDRKILGTFVHPYVRWEMAKAVLYYYLTGHWAVVLDIPLLFESGLDIFCGTVLVAAVSDPAIQMKRLRERDPHLSAEDAENRVKSQGDVREKAKRAEARSANGRGFVVWNDGGKEDLKAELERVVKGCRRASPGWWAWMLLFMPPVAGTLGMWSMLRAWVERRKWQAMQERERAKLS
jgi:dephospho-CoA kinase